MSLSVSQIKRNFFIEIKKKQFDKLYKDQQFIGQGTQGKVSKAYFEGQPVAIKQFKKQYMVAQYIKYIQYQIQNLQQIRHDNIVDLIQSYKVTNNEGLNVLKYCIVTQFCQGKLSPELTSELTDIQKLKVCQQIVAGIKQAHDHGVMHRDIKPQNILIKTKAKMDIKIADFGCSRISQGNQIFMTQSIGTPLYADPNIQTGSYTVKCDVYSLGLVIMDVFCGQNIFSQCKTKSQLRQKQQSFFANISEQTSLFLQKFPLTERITQFLLQVTQLTMVKEQKSRYKSISLLQFIQNQISDIQSLLQSDNLNSTLISRQPSILQTSTTKKGQNKIEVVEIVYDKVSVQKKIDQVKTKKQIQSERQINQTQNKSLKSQKSNPSFREASTDYQSPKKYENDLTASTTNNQTTEKQSNSINSFQEVKEVEEQISIISNASNKSSTKNKSNYIKTSKVTSSIIQAKPSSILNEQNVQVQKRKKQLFQQRIKNIQQNSKNLTEEDKTYATFIRYDYQLSNINYQLQISQRIFSHLKTYKSSFQKITLIKSIHSLNLYQKQCIAFLYHYLYVCKIQDLIKFSEGQYSNLQIYLKIDPSLVSQRTKQKVKSIAQAQSQKITGQLVRYSSDLYRKLQLIRPRLSQYISRAVTDISFSQRTLTINLKPNQIKNEIRNYIEQKIRVIRNQAQVNTLQQLIIALNDMN